MFRKAFKIFLYYSGGWIPMEILLHLSGQKIILPFYHAVSDEELLHMKHLYQVKSSRQFELDLDRLLKHFVPLNTGDLKSRLTGSGSGRKPGMYLSFDDGLRQCYEIILPVLERKGIPATFFVNPEFLDNRGLFYRYKASLILERLRTISYSGSILELINSNLHLELKGRRDIVRYVCTLGYEDQQILDRLATFLELDFRTFLKVKKPYLTRSQVLEMKTKGFNFGGHSLDHPHFSRLSTDQQLHQAWESVKEVDEMLEQKDGLFAFPFFDVGVGKEFFTKLYSNAEIPVSLSFGTSGLKKSSWPEHLHRIPMEGTGLNGKASIKSEYLYYLARLFKF